MTATSVDGVGHGSAEPYNKGSDRSSMSLDKVVGAEDFIEDAIDTAVGSIVSVGGSTTQIQYNNAGVIAGDSGFTTNGSGSVNIVGDLDIDNININGNTISTTNTDGPLVLRPNAGLFSGGIIYAECDNETAGGTRGSRVVDLQLQRSSSSQIASGSRSAMIGGRQNTVSGPCSFVGGGQLNVVSGAYAATFGQSNTLGNNGEYSFICGQSNSLNGSRGFIAGGSNSVTVDNCFALGHSNTINSNGGYSTAIGKSNTVSSWHSHAIGGYNTSSGYYTMALGFRSVADKYGQLARANGRFTANGDAQTSIIMLRNTTSNNSQTELFANGTSARMAIPSDSAWMFTISIVARRTDADGECAAYKIEGCIDNNAGTTALVGTITKTDVAEDNADWDVTAEADNTNDALVVKVTGENGKTIRWVARVDLIQVTG